MGTSFHARLGSGVVCRGVTVLRRCPPQQGGAVHPVCRTSQLCIPLPIEEAILRCSSSSMGSSMAALEVLRKCSSSSRGWGIIIIIILILTHSIHSIHIIITTRSSTNQEQEVVVEEVVVDSAVQLEV